MQWGCAIILWGRAPRSGGGSLRILIQSSFQRLVMEPCHTNAVLLDPPTLWQRLCLDFPLRGARFMLNVPKNLAFRSFDLALGDIQSPRCATKRRENKRLAIGGIGCSGPPIPIISMAYADNAPYTVLHVTVRVTMRLHGQAVASWIGVTAPMPQ